MVDAGFIWELDLTDLLIDWIQRIRKKRQLEVDS